MSGESQIRKDFLAKVLAFTGLSLLIGFGTLLRILPLKAVSADMPGYLTWFDFLLTHGITGLGTNFSVYTPSYLYLFWLATLTSGLLPKVVAIKSISITADLVNTFLIYKLVQLRYPVGLKPMWAALIFFCLPTVFINSAVWGQVDSVYTIFLLACIYFYLIDQPMWAMTVFGISLSFKAQAVFLMPFLLVMMLKRKILWHYLLVPPMIYALTCLPTVLLGRSWLDVLTIYSSQASTFQSLSRNAPNLYIFIPDSAYDSLLLTWLVVGTIIVGIWILYNRTKSFHTLETVSLTALVSLALVPFVLPKMHDRYFYPADAFSLVAAFFMPQLWFVPILYQIISLLAYLVFLFDKPPLFTQVGAVLNTLTILFLIWKQSTGVPNENTYRQ